MIETLVRCPEGNLNEARSPLKTAAACANDKNRDNGTAEALHEARVEALTEEFREGQSLEHLAHYARAIAEDDERDEDADDDIENWRAIEVACHRPELVREANDGDRADEGRAVRHSNDQRADTSAGDEPVLARFSSPYSPGSRYRSLLPNRWRAWRRK